MITIHPSIDMRLLQSNYNSTNDEDIFREKGDFGTAVFILVYGFLFIVITTRWYMQRIRRRRQTDAIRTLFERTRTAAASGTQDNGGENADIRQQLQSLIKEILLEHFKSHGRCKVSEPSCFESMADFYSWWSSL